MTDTACLFSQFQNRIAIGFFFGIKGDAIKSGFNRLVFIMSKLHIQPILGSCFNPFSQTNHARAIIPPV